jgi:aspartyl protease family protein
MNGDRALDLVWALGCLVLVGSALAARRVPVARAWKMALAWLAIFGAIFLLFAFHDDFGMVGQRLRVAIYPETGIVSGETLQIPMSDDGHFWVRGLVNGTEQRFLVDSGATTVVLSADAVREAGISVDDDDFASLIQTANGTVAAHRIRIGRLAVGPIARDNVAAVTADEFGDINVLGMNFLSTLSAWGVEGRTLVLKS